MLSPELLSSIISWIIGFLFLWIGITYIMRRKNFFEHVSSHSQEPFHNQHFSAKEIYAAITAAVKERQIPNVSFSTVTHLQHYGLFTDRREYLRISRGDVMFLVCAAPLGTDYFISCWCGEPVSNWKDFVKSIPFIGPRIARRMAEQTFFQIDTEAMFQGAVSHAVKHVTGELRASSGMRPLTELGHAAEPVN